MSERTWEFIDKTGWPSGPWKTEPDKVQWVDAATGLDCLARRVPRLGHWCGYVGVPEGHPYYGKDFDGLNLDVHGGLTFSQGCAESGRAEWEKWRARVRASKAEAMEYPQGDSAYELRTKGHLLDDFEGWRKYQEGVEICHVPEAGRSDKIWWLGFDCAHACDLSPGMSAMSGCRMPFDVYRPLSYVRQECASLAAQVAKAGT